ncbi:hypothetical protein AJ80_04646 [Polytolypa hystricis UAMH7299]|uniref:EGF domain-specific O-linked N-acetylglucosamine transferase n=1 Tax=Polytolypa hystricis (strain UAMH7299) TaxID=1447883 RepID=A0A2B7Y9V1_POLH7|nr:hypothetical protein AJ80_04646 [Polytolypa hystricis UAMH7299]
MSSLSSSPSWDEHENVSSIAKHAQDRNMFTRLWNLSKRRYMRVAVGVAAFLFLAALTLQRFSLQSQLRERFQHQKPLAGSESDSTRCEDAHSGNEKHCDDTLNLPSDYDHAPEEPPFCASRFGRKYLDDFRDSATGYCSQGSASSLTCFHTNTSPVSPKLDSFCFARHASFNITGNKVRIDCKLKDSNNNDNERTKHAPPLENFPGYWYETGPRFIFENYIDIEQQSEETKEATSSQKLNNIILLKREGAFNTWHSMIEIFSMTLSMDILQMTKDPTSNAPFFTVDDIEDTHVLILDEHDDGPYFDLWTLFAKKPILKLSNISPTALLENFNVIIPLPGGSNPTWQGDWKVNPCTRGELLRTFSQRVLDFYNITKPTRTDDNKRVKVTFIDRTESRRLTDSTAYLAAVSAAFPYVDVQSIDFAAIPFKEQVSIIRNTDVLVGVHGGGLTHGMFLPAGSAMVEILPAQLDHKGFHNLAKLLGHTYFRTHARKPRARRDAWHGQDVFLDKERFVELVGAAVRSMYNKGSRNYDIN